MIRALQDAFMIPLTQNQTALIDERDYHWLREHRWYALWYCSTKSFRAVRKIQALDGKRQLRDMSRAILGLEHGDPRQADHINHNTLDNRRHNLRIVTHRQNNEHRRNPSAFGLGVRKKRGRFQARVKIGGKEIHIGHFDTAEAARQARRNYLERHGGV